MEDTSNDRQNDPTAPATQTQTHDASAFIINVLYGVDGSYTDVTRNAFILCVDPKKLTLTIPGNDWDRSSFFGDVAINKRKEIVIVRKQNESMTMTKYDCDTPVIDLAVHSADPSLLHSKRRGLAGKLAWGPTTQFDTPRRFLEHVHERVKLQPGETMKDEYPEQLMAATFIRKDARVLELGSNVGRNTLVIDAIVNDSSKQLVTLESNPEVQKGLKANRDANGARFVIENAALSYLPLIQKGWDTVPHYGDDDRVPEGFTKVNTVTLEQLVKKHGDIAFDTLVADCEGALYHILASNRNMLKSGFHTLILENDYHDPAHKKYVDDVFAESGFERVYVGVGPWGPCAANFFEVWYKRA